MSDTLASPLTKRQRTVERAPRTTSHDDLFSHPLTVVIFGATGDLAKKKLFPALFKLCLERRIPTDLNIVGYGRSAVDLPAFIAKQCVNVADDERYHKESFVKQISFHAGGYDSPASYTALDAKLREYESAHPSGLPGNRLFFLSVPPSVFGTVTEMLSLHARASPGGFTRLMIEKPFGHDSASFEELNQLTARHFEETQLFRIDHYLGKEVLLNISTLRWANACWEPMWSAAHIESVQIIFKENIGTEGRGGYFDGIGIVRDIIQNHLMQAFMFLAMEPPADMSAAAILDRKVELLKAVQTLDLHTPRAAQPLAGAAVFLGQFGPSTRATQQKGYLDDDTVPPGSCCPTMAACVLAVDNERWRGVPFLLSAGKGLDERLCEFRIRFKPQPYNRQLFGADAQNELVMRVQPDEALYMVACAKQPGISAGLAKEERRTPIAMGLRYATQFGDGSPFVCGDAYERMLLNAARGEQGLSVSASELVEAWRIFTPLLHQIDKEKPPPVVHPFGQLPAGYVEWAAAHGFDVHPLEAAWGGQEAEQKLRDDLEAHKAELARVKAAEIARAAQDDMAFGY